jgi:hypothetical protein
VLFCVGESDTYPSFRAPAGGTSHVVRRAVLCSRGSPDGLVDHPCNHSSGTPRTAHRRYPPPGLTVYTRNVSPGSLLENVRAGELRRPDGRTVAWCEWGALDGCSSSTAAGYAGMPLQRSPSRAFGMARAPTSTHTHRAPWLWSLQPIAGTGLHRARRRPDIDPGSPGTGEGTCLGR